MTDEFWKAIQQLVESSQIIIDRPKGTTHSRFPGANYPVDYGFLEGTTSMDMGGVDVFVGSLGIRKINGIVCTVDLQKRDAEVKILYDCSDDEISSITNFINTGMMRAIVVKVDDERGK